MAQIHAIDGTVVNYISQAIWDQSINSQSLNLIAVHNVWRQHLWISNVMTATERSTLTAKRGSIVSVTTTDPNNPNGDYLIYYNAIVRNISTGNHDSLNFVGVQIEFLIKV